LHLLLSLAFYLQHTPPPAIYTLSLHDALPIFVPSTIASRIDSREMVALPSLLSSSTMSRVAAARPMLAMLPKSAAFGLPPMDQRSEEHTSELQSRENLVCRLLLEKKKKKKTTK